jgi:hypothetical protein
VRALAAMGLVVLAACACVSTQATATSSPSVAPSARPALPILPPVSPAPTAEAPDCYLPVYWYGQDGNSFQTGFLRYPEGTLQGPQSMPIGHTNGGMTYDRTVNRWLPVPPGAVSADGLSFAFANYDLPVAMGGHMIPMSGILTTTGRVYVVDARTGAGRIIFSGSPTYSVAGFTADGVYLSQVELTQDGQFNSGLFLLNPAGGTPVAVPGGARSVDRAGWRVEGGSAWGSDFATGGGITGGNRLLSLDLKTGHIAEWKTWPDGVTAYVVGFVFPGLPLVAAYQASVTVPGPSPAMQGVQLWGFTAPGTGKIVYQSADPTATPPTGPSFNDSHGAWLGGGDGAVWLFAGQALNRVAVSAAGASLASVGGQCV